MLKLIIYQDKRLTLSGKTRWHINNTYQSEWNSRKNAHDLPAYGSDLDRCTYALFSAWFHAALFYFICHEHL